MLFLLENGSHDMNKIAALPFTQEDREQFAQLIGYSLSGFSELFYVSDDTYNVALKMSEQGKTEQEARIEYLEGLVRSLRKSLRKPMAELFGVNPGDLRGTDQEDDDK